MQFGDSSGKTHLSSSATSHHHHHTPHPTPPHPAPPQKKKRESSEALPRKIWRRTAPPEGPLRSSCVVLLLPRRRLTGAVVLLVLLWRVRCFAFSSSMWVLLLPLLSFWKVWPCPVLFWRGAAFLPPSLGRCRSLPLSRRWCYPSPLRLGGSPFPPSRVVSNVFFSNRSLTRIDCFSDLIWYSLGGEESTTPQRREEGKTPMRGEGGSTTN